MDTKSPSKNEPFKRSELKKNPKVDVARNSSIYFAVGLALMLFLTYSTLNYKTYDKSNIDIGKLNLDNELDEEIPVIEQVAPPPPPSIPPPIAPQVIEVVEDEVEVEETVIESTETNQEDEIMEIEDVEVQEVEEIVEVPFAVIENVPKYPGCERGSNADKRQCM